MKRSDGSHTISPDIADDDLVRAASSGKRAGPYDDDLDQLLQQPVQDKPRPVFADEEPEPEPARAQAADPGWRYDSVQGWYFDKGLEQRDLAEQRRRAPREYDDPEPEPKPKPAARFGRVAGAGGAVDLLMVTGAIGFLLYLLVRGWMFGGWFTIELFAAFGLDSRLWLVPVPFTEWSFPAPYLLPLAVGAYQWIYCPYKFRRVRIWPGLWFIGGRRFWWLGRNHKVPADWRFWFWWFLFLLDIGSSFGGVWLYLDGREFTLFAQTITFTSSVWYGAIGIFITSVIGSIICAYAPERVGRPAVAELWETWRDQIAYWRSKPAAA